MNWSEVEYKISFAHVGGRGRCLSRRCELTRRPSNENEVGGLIYALGAYDETKYLAVAKAGGDPRSRIDQNYRPLKKVTIVGTELLPK